MEVLPTSSNHGSNALIYPYKEDKIVRVLNTPVSDQCINQKNIVNSYLNNLPGFATYYGNKYFMTQSGEVRIGEIFLNSGTAMTDIYGELSKIDKLSIIISITMIIANAQQKYQFQHNDLGTYNIVLKKISKPQIFTIDDCFVVQYHYVPTIIDYDGVSLVINGQSIETCNNFDVLVDGRLPEFKMGNTDYGTFIQLTIEDEDDHTGEEAFMLELVALRDRNNPREALNYFITTYPSIVGYINQDS